MGWKGRPAGEQQHQNKMIHLVTQTSRYDGRMTSTSNTPYTVMEIDFIHDSFSIHI